MPTPPSSGRCRAAAVLATALLSAPALAAAPPPAACCRDPAEFSYQPLPLEGTVKFAIGPGSPRFEFQSGPSVFRAFALPAASRPYLIEIRSFVDGGPDPRRARVFYPVVAVLTDDFLVSRSTDLDNLRVDLPEFENARRTAYRITLPVDPANAHERYLVVFTPARLLEPRVLGPATTPAAAAEVAHAAFLGATTRGEFSITLSAADQAPPGETDATTP